MEFLSNPIAIGVDSSYRDIVSQSPETKDYQVIIHFIDVILHSYEIHF